MSFFSERLPHPVLRSLLGPVLLIQAGRVRRTALRLPEARGPRLGLEGQHHAPAPLIRLMVLGDSSAAGVGVPCQTQALAMPAARALSTALSRPVGWQLLARTGVSTSEALQMMASERVCQADAALIALGVNDVTGQRSPAAFRRDTENLLETLSLRYGVRVSVLTAIPPMHRFPVIPQPLRWYLGACARRLDEELRRLCAADPTRHVLGLDWADTTRADAIAEDGYHPGPSHYAQWASQSGRLLGTILADHVGGFLGKHHCSGVGVA